ncbi:MAG: lysine--tRNA ligase [Rhizobiales bacterium]|nr:lysine--tRNA ligase [Hyphomicrobiales bacterium]MBI3673586.1 lysine--tRNA ligase [Hyphomicrobiales bacterium]
MPVDPALRSAALESRAWPFEEARKLVARAKRLGKTEVLFETGYGPSGLPHIGTFGEVARTTMVRHAFETLCDIPTRLLCFSDDMDGMRKIPDNVPDRSFLAPHLHKPLTVVPDPFGGAYESFGHHNNAMLRRFLDTFGFQYEFASATDYYKSGKFDAMLLKALDKFDAIMAVMLPSLGEERQATYSPFLPISPSTGRVLYVPMKEVNAKAGTITFADEDGSDVTIPVTGGRCKLQWKPDFGMRWAALGVDFEMFGKDHQTNAPIYDRICEILGGVAPEHYVYELFLDEKGQKISKSKGNGLTIDEWLTYADPQSLALYMYNRPREAKKLYFDVIPRAVDEYAQFQQAYPRQEAKERLMNPVWHIHAGNPPPPEEGGVSFSLLLNLVAVANAEDKSVLWGFLKRHAPNLSPATHPRLDALAGHAVRYFADFVKPKKQYRPPTEDERMALEDLSAALALLPEGSTPEAIQTKVYDVGRRDPYKTVQKDGSTGVAQGWFNMLYQVLLGEEKGPRFGSFTALYGLANTRALIGKALRGELVK